MAQIPHPALLRSIPNVPDPPDCPESTCDWARKLRVCVRDLLASAAVCPEVPLEISSAEGGEKWDHATYIRALRQTIEWTYKICELEAEVEEGPYMAQSHPEPCRRGDDCCARRHYRYY